MGPIRSIHLRGDYSIRGVRFRLEHGSEDIGVFREIFQFEYYQPPAHIREALSGSGLRILDLGGNVGLFGVWAAVHWPGCHVTAFEPDPASAARYRECIAINGLDWTVEEACACSYTGKVGFASGAQTSSAISQEARASLVEAIDVLPYVARTDFIKMDIEGGEWDILMDERFLHTTARAIVMEYHPHLCPSADPRSLAMQRLTAAGFDVEEIFFDDQLNVGMVWGVRSGARATPA
jgi:FkbM family methyltransferase